MVGFGIIESGKKIMQNSRGLEQKKGNCGFPSKLPLSEKPRVLIIDNFDSFTYNLVQLIGTLKAETVVKRNNAISAEEIRILSPDAIVISPGPGHPANARDVGITMDAIREFAGKVPILGVCLGHQAIIHAFGGQIVRAKKPMHGKTSEIEYLKKGFFHNLEGELVAMRYHSLVGEKSSLPDCLEVIATSKDDGEIMAVQHKTLHLFGVQFHPESVFTEKGPMIIENFLQYIGGSYPG